jgi:sterol 14-demethylase
MVEFARNPVDLMLRVRERCGPVGEFRMFNKDVVLLSGSAAQETFCRAPDEQLSQKIAYRLMTPIFGEGVVFDAPMERMNEQLRILMPALRDRHMRTYASVFVNEVERMVAGWGEAGEIDLLAFTAELTTYTSSHCLLGKEFRESMNEEFARVYSALEQGVNAIAYVNPYLPLPVFRRRDRARARLLEMVTEIIEARARTKQAHEDALQVLTESRYGDGTALTANEITGILIATMFAGHHTSSGTAAWTVIELLRNPAELDRVLAEIESVHGADGELTHASLREVPVLEGVIKEVLRLHPPLIILMRGVLRDFEVAGHVIPMGKLVAISPAVSHRLPEHFRDPERFDPSRYQGERAEDADPFAWIPFGGGLHRCSGSAFALMQLKAIVTSLLRRYRFELVDDPASYVDDFTKMVVQPRQPCRVRYRQAHRPAPVRVPASARANGAGTDEDEVKRMRVRVDYGLCQGHGVCMSEAPEVFRVDEKSGQMTLLDERPPEALRAKVAQAVKYCPTHALKLVDE